MPVLAFDPARTLLRLQENLDRIHSNPSGGLGAFFGDAPSSVFPPVNVFLDHEGLVVRAEVPGFRREDLSIAVEPRRLRMSGEQRAEEDGVDAAQASYHRRERQRGNFDRALQIPDDLDTDGATAECMNGVLTIRIPKQPEHKPKKVTIS